MIHVYTGNGKGKTTAAVGLLIRAFGSGKKVGTVLFDKGSETYKHNELTVFDQLNIEYHVTGLERMNPDKSFRFGVIDKDKQEAFRGIEIAEKLICYGKFDLLVLDEILSSSTYGMLPKEKILEIMSICPKELELILTGRCNDLDIFAHADLITSMEKLKHYFDTGILARSGIEY